MSKENVTMEDFEKVTYGLDSEEVIEELKEKVSTDIQEFEEENKIKSNVIPEVNSEYLSYQNNMEKHNTFLKNKEYERRVNEKEIQLVGIPKEELAENKKLLKKFNRKTKRIQQQEKKDTNREMREENKRIEKEYITKP